MAIKNFKTKEEALAAMKKATDRKRTLIEYLKKNDMYDNTVIAIYGDHQGMNKETPSVQWKMTDFLGKEYDYDEMLNVPFIIHIPGLNESKVVDTVGGEVDIMPTIANLMDLDTKQPYVFGHDLLNADEGFIAQISLLLWRRGAGQEDPAASFHAGAQQAGTAGAAADGK